MNYDLWAIPIPGFCEPVSSLSHLVAALLALVGSVWLIKKGRGIKLRTLSLVIFCMASLLLFSFSGLYHSFQPGPARSVFRRLDYAAIWVMIAGSATPIHVILLRGFWRWGMLSIIWGLSLICLVITVVFFTSISFNTAASLYLGISWVAFVSGARIWYCYGYKPFVMLLIGGLCYSFGAIWDIFDIAVIWPGVIGPHEMFHFFVIAGAASHWYFMFKWGDFPIADGDRAATTRFNRTALPPPEPSAS